VEIVVEKAKCCYKFQANANSSKETTHLANHLKRCTGKSWQNIRQQLLQAPVRKDDGTCALSNYEYELESQKLLTRAIIFHEYPFNIVTHDALLDYIHHLRPSHKGPSRTTITKLCRSIYDDEKRILYDMFGNFACKVSLAIDKWTASSQKMSYLCIMAHFIDDNWQLQKRIINFIVHTCVWSNGLRNMQCFNVSFDQLES